MNSQKTYTINVQGEKGSEVTLSLSGRIETENLNAFMSEAKPLLIEKAPGRLIVDLSEVVFLDSAGALGLVESEDRTKARSIPYMTKMEMIGRVVFQRDYRFVEPLEAETPEGLAQGISRAMEKFSKQMILDVSRALKNR